MQEIIYKPFTLESHLTGVLALFRAEGWESFNVDSTLAGASLIAPGVTSVVAVSGGRVIGVAQMQGDGVLQAHLSIIVVDAAHRGRGIGKRLIEETFERCGCRRVDLIASEGSEVFYESFVHKVRRGFRIYPRDEER